MLVDAGGGGVDDPQREDPSERRRWLVEVVVLPKVGVNDPEGEAILGGLRSLGHAGTDEVRAGRFIRLILACESAEAAAAQATTVCEELLANPVIHTYQVTVREPLPPSSPEGLGEVA